MLRVIHVVAVANDPKFTKGRREAGLGDAVDQSLMLEPVSDELCDCDERKTMFCGKALEIRAPRHGAVGVEDLADDSRGIETGEPREIDARFGLADALQHAAGTRAEREDVTGAPQIARHR